eukprot:3587844-Prymnesium_polylepis.1
MYDFTVIVTKSRTPPSCDARAAQIAAPRHRHQDPQGPCTEPHRRLCWCERVRPLLQVRQMLVPSFNQPWAHRVPSCQTEMSIGKHSTPPHTPCTSP